MGGEGERERGEKLFWQIKLKYFTLYSQLSSQIFLRYLSEVFKYVAICRHKIYFIISPDHVLKSDRSRNRKRQVFCQRSHCKGPAT